MYENLPLSELPGLVATVIVLLIVFLVGGTLLDELAHRPRR